VANLETRPTIDVKAAVGGWPYPWPNVSEIARVLPSDRWTLIGGLMTLLHAIHHGIDAVRPTNDVDIVLHIETARGTPNATASALESLGYEMKENLDPRNNVGHRFTRGEAHVDVVSSDDADIVDVVVADHAAPSVEERMRRMDMVKIPGGTQALRRTVNYRLEIEESEITTISVPRPFGALILKAAAYVTDSRDPERHLFDAAVLLACIDNPIAERESFAGSDRSRMLVLERELVEGHRAWLRMPVEDARRGRAVLRALCAVNDG
jgi:predicted nucleotidyltransferase